MTGAEHYRQAERLLGEGITAKGDDKHGDPWTEERAQRCIAAAHVHATLALFESLREIRDRITPAVRPALPPGHYTYPVQS